MEINEFIKLFVAVKADEGNFQFELPKNYTHVFAVMMNTFNELTNENQENLSALYNINEYLTNVKKDTTSPQYNHLVKSYFGRHMKQHIIENDFKVKRSSKDFHNYQLIVNPLLIEDTINNTCHNDLENIKEVIYFFDKIDNTVNDKGKNVKRK